MREVVDLCRGQIGVLLEALRFRPNVDAYPYLLSAVAVLADDSSRDEILRHLSEAPDLIRVVVDHDWVDDVEELILRRLSERSPTLSVDWIRAAAAVAGPDAYDDLVFQVTDGLNPWQAWKVVRSRGEAADLADKVGAAWRSTSRVEDFHRWGQLAVVSASEGDIEALQAVAADASSRAPRIWQSREQFRRLTRYKGHDRDAASWLSQRLEAVVFDRSSGIYEVR